MNLDAATRQLYEVFSVYPKPANVPGCTHCCISPQELETLAHRPLSELTPDDLRRYALNAADTVGSEPDFKYLLPRLLDFAAADAFGWPDPGWVVRRLRFVPWETWPEAERVAIRVFLQAWWTRLLETGSQTELGEGLESLTCVEADLSPYLKSWLSGDRHKRLALAEFVLQHITQLGLERAWGNWASAAASRAVYGWLCSGAVAQVLEAEYAADPVAPEALTFVEAAGLVWPT